jgi:hypothetical protein
VEVSCQAARRCTRRPHEDPAHRPVTATTVDVDQRAIRESNRPEDAGVVGHDERDGALVDHVGYDEAGQLTGRVRREPVFDLLFDKIGKARPDVFNLLLQLLDGGAPPDGQGRTVDFPTRGS